MKKYILSPLCSAFVVPGLGQVLNEQIKKGLLLLGLVFILLVTAAVRLAMIINRPTAGTDRTTIDLRIIPEKMISEGPSLLGILVLCFALLWIYAVIDAFWAGWKIERGKDEILPD